MGISRDSRHKRRSTGGRRAIHQKKRKYELARPAAMTKLGGDRVHLVRTRGGNTKKRALRVETGSFSWGSKQISMKSKIINVVYSATSNDYVRTNIVTKGVVVSVDATPFKAWYRQKFGIELGRPTADNANTAELNTFSTDPNHEDFLELNIADQLKGTRLLAMISSRPGQVGAANGYILEGAELAFYKRKIEKKKKH